MSQALDDNSQNTQPCFTVMFSLLNGKAGDIVTTAYTLACARAKEAMLSGEASR